MPSRHLAIMGATEASTSADALMNSLIPRVRFSSISCNLLNTYKEREKERDKKREKKFVLFVLFFEVSSGKKIESKLEREREQFIGLSKVN